MVHVFGKKYNFNHCKADGMAYLWMYVQKKASFVIHPNNGAICEFAQNEDRQFILMN